jgi:very-short-patch-repair endonuclease
VVTAGPAAQDRQVISDSLSALAERQFGLLSSSQLRALGHSPNAFAQRAAGTEWEALSDEVLRRVGAPRGRGQTAMAAVLDAGRGAHLSHSSGGSWWGVPGLLLEPVHVVRTSRTARRPPLVEVLHTVRSLPPEWTTVLDGVPVVRPEQLAMQLFSQYRYERAERHVDALWSMRLLSGRSLRRLVIGQGRRGRNGIGGLRRFLDERGDDYVPPATGLEGRAIKVLKDAGIPMRRQVDSGGDRWTGRVDLRHEEVPLIAEVQSDRFHRALSSRRDDEQRRARLGAQGFVVVELWEDQVWHRPWEVVDHVARGVDEARARRRRSSA